MKFIQAKYKGGKRAVTRNIVLHTTENSEHPSVAENVAMWFSRVTDRQVSAHYVVDNDSIVQCVHDDEIAWHAKGANLFSIGIEQAGRAYQSTDDWRDPYSVAMLSRSAALCAHLCQKYSIPVVFVDSAGLRRGERGITTHHEVSKAFPPNNGHYDPGPSFPIGHYMATVKHKLDPSMPPLPGEVIAPKPVVVGQAAALQAIAALIAYIYKYNAKRGPGQHAANTLVQKLLRNKGYNVSVDGEFGPQTEFAVKQFQRKRGLSPDGVVGRLTLTALAS